MPSSQFRKISSHTTTARAINATAMISVLPRPQRRVTGPIGLACGLIARGLEGEGAGLEDRPTTNKWQAWWKAPTREDHVTATPEQLRGRFTVSLHIDAPARQVTHTLHLRRRVNQRTLGLLQLRRPIEGTLRLNPGHAQNALALLLAFRGSLGLDVRDHLRDLPAPLGRRQILPARQRSQLQEVVGDILLAGQRLTSAPGLAQLRAVDPNAVQRHVVDERLSTVEPLPVGHSGDEIFLDAVREAVAEALFQGLRLVGDRDRVVAVGPELLVPFVDEHESLVGDVAVDELHEVGELFVILRGQDQVPMVREVLGGREEEHTAEGQRRVPPTSADALRQTESPSLDGVGRGGPRSAPRLGARAASPGFSSSVASAGTSTAAATVTWSAGTSGGSSSVRPGRVEDGRTRAARSSRPTRRHQSAKPRASRPRSPGLHVRRAGRRTSSSPASRDTPLRPGAPSRRLGRRRWKAPPCRP